MEKSKTPRIWELDFLRGLSIILMVFDHLMYDLNHLPGIFSNFYQIDNPFFEKLFHWGESYWYSDLRAGGHYVFVAIFLIVSGISFNFSHNNFRRGLKFLAVALLITGLTWGLDLVSDGAFQFLTVFGIIHLFAVGTLLTLLLRKIWDNDLFLFVCGAAVVFIGVLFQFWQNDYYDELNFGTFFLMIFGVKGYGADYFGIAPFAGVILIGSAIGNFFYPEKKSLLPGMDHKWNLPFVYAGRKSFLIFVTHQFVLFALVLAIGYLLGYRI